MEEMPLKEALTPPASEENNGRARSNSDLSDLSMEDPANQDPIEPDHYYEGGKIPVFKPVSWPRLHIYTRRTARGGIR